MIFTGTVLIDKQQRIYLIKEDDRNKIGQDRWNLPGGSVDTGEGLIEAAQRETVEETGYSNTITSLLGIYKASINSKEWVYIVFSADVDLKTAIAKIDKSVKDGKWFTKEEFLSLDISQIVHPDMFAVYKLAIEQKGLDLKTVKLIKY